MGIGVEAGVAIEAGELGVRRRVEVDVVVALRAGRFLRAGRQRQGTQEPDTKQYAEELGRARRGGLWAEKACRKTTSGGPSGHYPIGRR